VGKWKGKRGLRVGKGGKVEGGKKGKGKGEGLRVGKRVEGGKRGILWVDKG
jgi:hypothetical protein